MKNLHSFVEKIAPMTKEQYEAKLAYNKKKANELINMVICQRKKVTLFGTEIRFNKKQNVFIKLIDWNVRDQRLKISIDYQTNEIPRKIAEDIVNAYLNLDFEYDWSWN